MCRPARIIIQVSRLTRLVDLWFAELTSHELRWPAHRTANALEMGSRAWVNAWNTCPDRSAGPRPPPGSST